MYMMGKLDAYKQEIEKQRVVSEWGENRLWAQKNLENKNDLLIRYAQEMLRIHEDVKRYCNALLIKAQEHNSSVDRLVCELRERDKKYSALNAKYKALKKGTKPVKKPLQKTAARKVAKPKGT